VTTLSFSGLCGTRYDVFAQRGRRATGDTLKAPFGTAGVLADDLGDIVAIEGLETNVERKGRADSNEMIRAGGP